MTEYTLAMTRYTLLTNFKPSLGCRESYVRHCERSEAIQWPYEMLGKVAGLLRRKLLAMTVQC